MTLDRSSLLHKRYRITAILGQGGMGALYRAVDENLGVDVAVKENLYTSADYSRQFKLEAVILANLRHPNLPRVTDHFVINNQAQYLVMDYIEGEDLRQRMERQGRISENEAIQIGLAICDALGYLHSRRPPILHRDIKPGNIKITPEGEILLVDFGLAKVLKGKQETTSGARAMTPGYSPPEQYGTSRTDARSDIYSLGATLYAAMTGVIPEDGLARAMDHLELTPLRKRNAKISISLAMIIEKCMAVRMEDRYQSTADLKSTLENLLTREQDVDGKSILTTSPLQAGDRTGGRLNQKKSKNKALVGLYGKKKKRPVLGALMGLFLFVTLAMLLAGAPPFRQDTLRFLDSMGLELPFFSTVAITQPSHTPTSRTLAASATSIVQRPTSTQKPTSTLSPSHTPTRQPTSALTVTTGITATASPTALGGGGGVLAFASDRAGEPQVFLYQPGAPSPVQITYLEGGACQPGWSPDGQRLVFISPCPGDQEEYAGSSLYLVNRDGSGITALTGIQGGNYDPSWSADASRIAFTSLRDGYPQIYMINLADDSVLRLTQTGADRSARQPAWNPFASAIAYSQKRYDAWQIWVMAGDGSGSLRTVYSDPNLSDTHPSWSMDSSVILFSQTKKLGVTSWLMTFDFGLNKTGFPSRLKEGDYASQAEYSPDGNWLVFEVSDGKNSDIYLMDVASGHRQLLVNGPSQDFDPSWCPYP